MKKDPYLIYPEITCAGAVTVGLIALACMLLLAANLIGWIMFPDIKAMNYILGLV